jgi:hypothetical protein
MCAIPIGRPLPSNTELQAETRSRTSTPVAAPLADAVNTTVVPRDHQ